jgi:hypothetical protein
MKKLFILSMTMVLTIGLSAQSKTVETFARTANGYDLYLYQSVIRMLNKDRNPDFNMLIRDLDHLKLITTDSIGSKAKEMFNKLDIGVRGEGFEEIVSYESRDSKLHLFELENDDDESTWVATMLFSGYAGVLEMKGSIDLAYMKALDSLNMDKLKELLPLEDFDQD